MDVEQAGFASGWFQLAQEPLQDRIYMSDIYDDMRTGQIFMTDKTPHKNPVFFLIQLEKKADVCYIYTKTKM